MPGPPAEYNICPCCGTEFENDDEFRTHTELRNYWISRGARWFFHAPPFRWNPWEQLALANVALPYSVEVSFAGASSFYNVDPFNHTISCPDEFRTENCAKENLAKAA
jgi:hypothetical protein